LGWEGTSGQRGVGGGEQEGHLTGLSRIKRLKEIEKELKVEPVHRNKKTKRINWEHVRSVEPSKHEKTTQPHYEFEFSVVRQGKGYED